MLFELYTNNPSDNVKCDIAVSYDDAITHSKTLSAANVNWGRSWLLNVLAGKQNLFY